jgi:hypothetical protein
MLWFAHGSAGYGKHFPPPPSPSRSAAATRASRPSKKRWDRLRAGLDSVLDQQGAVVADLPGGASGAVGARLQGEGSRSADDPHRLPAWSRWSPNCAPTSARRTEELGQWNTHHERRVIDASTPAASRLALMLTDEELDSVGERGLELEKSRGADDQVDQTSQALNRLRAMVSVPKYSPPMPRPPPGDRGWMV